GHATRCIPIIRRLLDHGLSPIIASDGRALLLLQKEFPQLKMYALPAYNIVYRSHNMVWNMAWQMPKILRAIYLEQKATEKIVAAEKIEVIISDNRYGCFARSTQNILMTHQINIKIPWTWMERVVAWANHRMIRRFDACWVPDFADTPRLAGTLSLAGDLPKVRYVGALSRMKKQKRVKQIDLLIVLSGPEPQRTHLEQLLLKALVGCPFRTLLVQGLTDREEREQLREGLERVAYLTSEALNRAILSAGVVLCRSGYSSIMDLVALGKKAILIPTPGQTEQEYLAERFAAQGICCVQKQNQLDLTEAMEEVQKTKGFSALQRTDQLLECAIKLLL
ncbi:MAG: glycosyltransferase, partial [Bacteroidota bacterium]